MSAKLNIEEKNGEFYIQSDQNDSGDVSKYSKLLSKQMAHEKILESFRIGSDELLKKGIDEYHRHELPDDADIIKTAETKHTDIENSSRDLKAASDRRSIEDLKRTLHSIRQRGLEKYLRKQVHDADELVEELRQQEVKMPILAMDKRTMAEIRSYAKASPLVHRVMQAALLLLKVDEGTTSEWTNCQKLCNPDGPRGMNRRLMQFEPVGIHPYIAARAETLLKGTDQDPVTLATVQKASPGAATFYVWAMGILQSVRDEAEAKEQSTFWDDDVAQATSQRPAKQSKPESLATIIQREKEIFSEVQGAAKVTKQLNKPKNRQNYYQTL